MWIFYFRLRDYTGVTNSVSALCFATKRLGGLLVFTRSVRLHGTSSHHSIDIEQPKHELGETIVGLIAFCNGAHIEHPYSRCRPSPLVPRAHLRILFSVRDALGLASRPYSSRKCAPRMACGIHRICGHSLDSRHTVFRLPLAIARWPQNACSSSR
jgi:hypothetical protein